MADKDTVEKAIKEALRQQREEDERRHRELVDAMAGRDTTADPLFSKSGARDAMRRGIGAGEEQAQAVRDAGGSRRDEKRVRRGEGESDG